LVCRKRAAYDNGDDLIDPSEMFGRGGFSGGMGGMGGANINIDPNILFNMMNGGGGGFAHAGGHSFGGAQQRGGFGGFPF
jgi:DnaJ family protein C protein 7